MNESLPIQDRLKSASAITEKYHNTAIPEFGMLVWFTLIASIFVIILISRLTTNCLK